MTVTPAQRLNKVISEQGLTKAAFAKSIAFDSIILPLSSHGTILWDCYKKLMGGGADE